MSNFFVILGGGYMLLADAPAILALFGEPATQVILTCSPENKDKIDDLVFGYPDLSCWLIGETVTEKLHVRVAEGVASDVGGVVIDCSIAELRESWAKSLEATLHDEVTA